MCVIACAFSFAVLSIQGIFMKLAFRLPTLAAFFNSLYIMCPVPPVECGGCWGLGRVFLVGRASAWVASKACSKVF